MWVNRFVSENGLIYLFKAMQKVIREYDDTRLVLIGEGPLKAEFIHLANKVGLTPKVNFFGVVSRNRSVQLLSKSRIFAFPSLKEGMPVGLLEPMASGNAVVASNIPGTSEIA